MSSQNPSLPQGEHSTQNSILENDNFTLAARNANVSIDNAVQLKDAPSQDGSVFERHVFSLSIAYSEIDVLARSVGVSQGTAVHAKSLYTQLYNYSDFDGHEFQHDTLIAACVYIASCEKDQPRTMPEVLKSTNATIQQMLTVCETLKVFLAVPLETRSLRLNSDRRLQFPYKEIDTLSDSNGIPSRASDHAKYLYKKIHDIESFKDEDHRPIIASCLLIACYQLNVPQNLSEIFTNDHGITKDQIARTLESLEAFYAARKNKETKVTPEIQNSVTTAAAEARSTNQIVNTLQEMIRHLNLEGDTSTTNQQSDDVRTSFAPTAPTSASIATSENDDNTKIGNSTAPNAPFTADKAYPFHGSTNGNIVSTFLSTGLAAVAGRKNARAVRNTLFNVICCQCKKILNLQNIHYTFQCVSCKHKRCNSCTMEAIWGAEGWVEGFM